VTLNEEQIRAAILAELNKGPLTVPGIVRATGISRLTVRAYVDRMVEKGEVVAWPGNRYQVAQPRHSREQAEADTVNLADRTDPTRIVDEDDPARCGFCGHHADVHTYGTTEGAAQGRVPCEGCTGGVCWRPGGPTTLDDIDELDKLAPGDRDVVLAFGRFLTQQKSEPGSCFVVREVASWSCWTHSTRWLLSALPPEGCQSPDGGQAGDFEAKLVERGLIPPADVVEAEGEANMWKLAEPGVVAWVVEDGGMVPVRVADVAKTVASYLEGPIVRDADDVLVELDGLPAAYAQRRGSASDAVVAAKGDAPEGVEVVRDGLSVGAREGIAADVEAAAEWAPRYPKGTPQYDAYRAALTRELKNWREGGPTPPLPEPVDPSPWYVERIAAAVASPYAAAIGYIEGVIGDGRSTDDQLAEIRVILASLERVAKGGR
jgi:hypothetical protein